MILHSSPPSLHHHCIRLLNAALCCARRLLGLFGAALDAALGK
jgi:hypothetical protein